MALLWDQKTNRSCSGDPSDIDRHANLQHCIKGLERGSRYALANIIMQYFLYALRRDLTSLYDNLHQYHITLHHHRLIQTYARRDMETYHDSLRIPQSCPTDGRTDRAILAARLREADGQQEVWCISPLLPSVFDRTLHTLRPHPQCADGIIVRSIQWTILLDLFTHDLLLL